MASRKKSETPRWMKWTVGSAVVIAAGFLVYTTFLSGGEAPPLEQQEDSLPSLKKNILESNRAAQFHSWSSVPVEVGETGRNNPFSR